MRSEVETSSETAPFVRWRAGLPTRPEWVRRFDQWLFLNAASVLLSEKTGELLAMSWEEFSIDEIEIQHRLKCLSAEWGFSFKLLHSNEITLKFVVYQKDRLQEVLDQSPKCVMCGQLNYAFPLTPKAFIDEIQERWEQLGVVPHEIGLALGYPVEDVFGYMGLMSLPCKGVCGWRVYGCMKESTRRSCAYQQARCTALKFLSGAPATLCS